MKLNPFDKLSSTAARFLRVKGKSSFTSDEAAQISIKPKIIHQVSLNEVEIAFDRFFPEKMTLSVICSQLNKERGAEIKKGISESIYSRFRNEFIGSFKNKLENNNVKINSENQLVRILKKEIDLSSGIFEDALSVSFDGKNPTFHLKAQEIIQVTNAIKKIGENEITVNSSKKNKKTKKPKIEMVHDEQWKNDFEKAKKEIYEISTDELDFLFKKRAIKEFFIGNFRNILEWSLDHEDNDIGDIVGRKKWFLALRLAKKIINGEIHVVYNADFNKSYIVGKMLYFQPKEISKIKIKTDKDFIIDVKEKEKMEEELLKAIHEIIEIPAAELRLTMQEGKVFSKNNIKEEMESLLNDSTQPSNPKKYWEELVRLSGAAKKIGKMKTKGHKFVVVNAYTYVIGINEDVSIENLEKSIGKVIDKEHLSAMEWWISKKFDIILKKLDENNQWRKISPPRRQIELRSAMAYLIDEILKANTSKIKTGKEAIEDIHQKIQHYMFGKIFEKQKL